MSHPLRSYHVIALIFKRQPLGCKHSCIRFVKCMSDRASQHLFPWVSQVPAWICNREWKENEWNLFHLIVIWKGYVLLMIVYICGFFQRLFFRATGIYHFQSCAVKGQGSCLSNCGITGNLQPSNKSFNVKTTEMALPLHSISCCVMFI